MFHALVERIAERRGRIEGSVARRVREERERVALLGVTMRGCDLARRWPACKGVAILALLRDVAPDQQKNRQDTKAAKEELQGPPRHLPLLFPCFLAPLAPWRFASQPYFPQ
jgi:hypothetical protein